MMIFTMVSVYILYGQTKGRKMKRILLTGASGFIGKNIKETLNSKYDIWSPSSQELDLKANCNDTRNSISAYDVLNGNLRMFFNLERCSHYYGKMIYFGSGAEYDRSNNIPNMSEDYFDTSVPKDAYGLSKYIMKKEIIFMRSSTPK